MEWENGNFSLENLRLVPLLDRIREARAQFTSLSFQHVYKELNCKADQLSKEALRLQEEMMEVTKVIDRNVQSANSLFIYF
jgi:hypothetical protein